MRHATQSQRLSRPLDLRLATVNGLVQGLVLHGQIQTTLARAKVAQRVADRLVSLGKEGSIHSRRQAFRVLKDRTLVSQLFTDIAPRYGDVAGGYTRVLRLALRRGDGAQKALLAFSRLPAPATALPKVKAKEEPKAPTDQPQEAAASGEPEKKGLLSGLRGMWGKKKKGSSAS